MARMTLRPSTSTAPPKENPRGPVRSRHARGPIDGGAELVATARRQLEYRPGAETVDAGRRPRVVAIVVEVTLSGPLGAGQDAETAALGHLVTGLLRAGGLVFQPAGQGSTWHAAPPWAHVLRWEPPTEG
jgi:hypothetical protein